MIAFSVPRILPGSRNDISEQQQQTKQLSALVEFILECSNFLIFFWICGCGTDIANCLDGSLEFWKSNAKEGLEIGAQILVWRLLKELFLFQWKTPHLTAERPSWEVLWEAELEDTAEEIPHTLLVSLERKGSFLIVYCIWEGSRNSLDNEPGISCSSWGLHTAGILSPEPFCNQCTLCNGSGISSGSIMGSRIRVISQCSVYCGLEVNVSEIIFLPSSLGSLWSSIEEMFLTCPSPLVKNDSNESCIRHSINVYRIND